jgi:hypothetical protein
MNTSQANYVFYISADWESFHRPDMIRAYARRIRQGGGKLLILDRMMCPFTGPLRGVKMKVGGPSKGSRKWFRETTGFLFSRNRIEQLDENLYLGHSLVLLDDRFARRNCVLMQWNRKWLGRQLKNMMLALDFWDRPLVTWFHYPTWEHYHGMLNEQLAVYECFDQHTANPGMRGARKRRLHDDEISLFRKMDLVFATSSRLAEIKKPYHQHIYHVPNGAEAGFYSKVQDHSIEPDPEYTNRTGPVIGYLGTIHEHTDLELINWIAGKEPDWTFVMIGKLDQRNVGKSEIFRELEARANVHMLGWVDRDRMLPICKSFNVCIIPYKRDAEFNRYVNPNKLHEYTAMGKPIVAYRGVDVDSHHDMIEVAEDPEGFRQCIERAWKTDSPEKIRQRLELAESNSWDARTETMVSRVNLHLHEKAKK